MISAPIFYEGRFMEITFLAVIGSLNVLWGLSTVLSWGAKRVGMVITRGREMRPQTRYFVS